MKKEILLPSLLFITCYMFGAYASSRVSVLGGDVKFNGQVVDGACSVRTDSRDQIVKMGQVRTNQFKEPGDWGDPVAFRIWLEGCNTSVSQTVGVMFTGETDSHDPLIFKAGVGASASKGIGIGIFDETGSLVIPSTIPTYYTDLNEGTNIIDFIAKYRSSEMYIQGGDASAQVWFSLVYP